VFGTEGHIEGVPSRLDEMVKEGLMTLEKARVVRHAPREG
jgi:hypothetical protein